MTPIQMTDSNGTYQIHSDHLATPKLLTNASEAVVWKAEHQAFGKAVVDEDPDNNSTDVTLNIRYPGQYFDAETGLHYNWHRYYDPNTGRYLQRDLIGLADGPNPYSYVSQNPLNLWDFTGLISLYRPGADPGLIERLPPGWGFCGGSDGYSARTGRGLKCDDEEEEKKKKCPTCPKPPSSDPDDDDETPDKPQTQPPIKGKNNPNSPSITPHGGMFMPTVYGANNLEGCMGTETAVFISDNVLQAIFKKGLLFFVPGGAIVNAADAIVTLVGFHDYTNNMTNCAEKHM